MFAPEFVGYTTKLILYITTSRGLINFEDFASYVLILSSSGNHNIHTHGGRPLESEAYIHEDSW